MRTRRAKVISFVALSVVGIIVCAFLYATRLEADPKFLTAPAPNAITMLLEAASKMHGVNPVTLGKGSAELVAKNEKHISRFRDAAAHDSELPAAYYAPNNNSFNDLRSIKELGRLASLQAKQLEEKREWLAAAEAYMDIVRVGHSVQRGPLISLIFGISIEKPGLNGLNRVTRHLSPVERATLANHLENLQRTAMNMEDVRLRERYYRARGGSWFAPVPFNPLSSRQPLRVAESKLDRIRDDLRETIALTRGTAATRGAAAAKTASTQ